MDTKIDLIIELLTDIRDRLASIEIANEAAIELERRREKDKVRKRIARESVHGQEDVRGQKESESKEGESKEVGKEDIPPTPPIEERAEEKKEPEKKDKENSMCVLRAREKGLFEEFWSAYPNVRKIKKQKSLQCFKSIFSKVKCAEDQDALFKAIMDGLERWKKSWQWVRDGGKFTNAPEVWLDNELWLDTPKTAEEVEADTDKTERKRLQLEAERKASAANSVCIVKHGATWRGTRPEDIQDVL